MSLHKLFKHLGLAIAIIITLLLTAPTNEKALAALIQCRSDPVVLLSDGTIVDVSADIGTMLYNVTEIDYTLHIPAGLTVVAVVSTPNWPTTIERFQIYADNPPGRFDSTTVVHTGPSNVSVKANMIVTQLLVIRVGAKNGYNGQSLKVRLNLP